MAVLPPEVDPSDFQAALQAFANVVGERWMFTSDEDVDLYRDAYSPFRGEPEMEKRASAAVAPASVEQVQEIMRIANRHRIPIYPIATGKNLGYGGAAPVHSGSVVLDLKRMNRILEFDEKNHTVLVEPGVSFYELYDYIRERGLRIWMDQPDPGWGSLIGNALEHGVGHNFTVLRDRFDTHCGMEVVLPDGDLLRTGMGALPGAESWQEYKYGFGPYVDGIFAQSNYGVVTKMGFWLMPEPDAYRSGLIHVSGYEDLIPLVDALNLVTNSGLSNGLNGLSSPLLNSRDTDGELGRLLDTPGGPDPADMERYALEHNVPYWTCKLDFYGPEEVIAAQWEYAREKFAVEVPGSWSGAPMPVYRFPLSDEQRQTLDGEGFAEKVSFGIPSLMRFSNIARSVWNPDPGIGHVFYSPVIPKKGEEIFKAQQVFNDAFIRMGVPRRGFASLPTLWYTRAAILLYGLPVRADAETNRKTRDTFRELVDIGHEHGWAEYRAPAAFMDEVMGAYDFNDSVLLRFAEQLKDAVDPNGILAAGRGGIWPRHLRNA